MPIWAVAAVAAACAGVLAVLHLLHIRRPQMRVITTLFWSQAVEAAPARSLWQRFRHPKTYVLLLAIGLLLALALGRPEAAGSRASTTSEVVVLDAGMPMRSPLASGGQTRFDAAKAAVIDEVRQRAERDSVAVVVLDPLPRVLLGFDEPRCVLAKRLQGLGCVATPAARSAGVELATAMLQGRPQGRMVVITDRPLADAGAERTGLAEEPQIVLVGEPRDNAAVLDAVFEPREDNPLRGRVVANIGFWGAAPTETRVVLERDGASLREETIRLTPGATQSVKLEDVPADGRVVSIRLAISDAIDADNVASFRVPRRNPIAVAVVGTMPETLQAMLGSDPTVRLVGAGDTRDVTLVCDESTGPAATPVIRVRSDGPAVQAGSEIEAVAGAPFTSELALHGATCGGSGVPAAGEGEYVLLKARETSLATLRNGSDRPELNLAAALFATGNDVSRQPALVIFVTRALRQLAGWDDARVSLPAERMQDDARWWSEIGGAAAGQVFAGSRRASDVSQPVAESAKRAATAAARWNPAPFEWLLLAALGLLVIEAVLHARGRIV